MDIINLYTNVIQALEFLRDNPPPVVDFQRFNLPLVVGSGNAYNTGLILFGGKAALFADESNMKHLVDALSTVISQRVITDAVIISADGEKDSVWEVGLAKQKGVRTTLLTTKPQSSAAQIADTVISFRSIPEPYTYNVSTYMGMIMGATRENPSSIIEHINTLTFPKQFGSYTAYSFVIPDAFAPVCPMLDIKKSELFGPHLSLRAFSEGQARHAKFVIRSEKELVISIGVENTYYGNPEHRWHISIPNDIRAAGSMAITYYIVGKIQESKPPYYKEHIEAYVHDCGPKAYGKTQPFDVIVPGSS